MHLDLSKVLMYEFHYDCIENKYGNKLRLLFTDTDKLMYGIKTEYVYPDFSKDKNSTKSKSYDNSNKLVVGKMIDETAGVPIEEFVGLKPKMYTFLVDDSSEHRKAKSVNKNVVATINHNEYNNVLLNQKCLRHSMSRIQSNLSSQNSFSVNL